MKINKVLIVVIVILSIIVILNKSKCEYNESDYFWGMDRINLEQANNITKGNKDTIVAIVDTGIDIECSELKNKIINPYNVSDDSFNVDDYNGHGTCIANIVAASDDGIGMTGIAPNVSIMPIKMHEYDINVESIAKALKYACDNGADIVNASISLDSDIENRYTFNLKEFKLNDRYEELYKNTEIYDVIKSNPDVLFIFSAGNNNQSSSQYPAKYDLDNIISVGASNKKNRLWKENILSENGSNYSRKNVDIVAPGEYIHSLGLDGFESNDGTSMAVPFVTGTAALIKSKYPNFNAIQIKEAILESVDKTLYLSTKTISGGVLDAYKALIAAYNMDTKKD